MKHPIAHEPQFRQFPPNVFPQMPANITVELAINGLALGDDFTMNNPSNIEENDMSMLLVSLRTCLALFQQKSIIKWVMLIILIIFYVNESHVTILSDLCIVAVVKYLHNLKHLY